MTIVDDDARIREALSELLESHGMRAIAFGSAGDYVGAPKPDVPACLILDVELPDINGLDLQGQIAEGDHPPIVFITGHGDIPSSVRAIKQAAAELGISEVTLQIHRRNVMQKLAAASLADLVRIAERLEIPITQSRRPGGIE